MNEPTRKKVLFVVLIAAVMFALVMQPWKSDPPQRSEPEADGSLTPSAPAAVATMVQPPQRVSTGDHPHIEFSHTWPENPFNDPFADESLAAVSTVPSLGEDLQLQGILSTNGQRVCVINGQTYETAMTVQGWRIVEIQNSAVLLQRKGNTRKMVLPEPETGQES